MSRKEIIDTVNNFLIEEIEIEIPLTSDSRLKEDLGIDSLDFVDIVVIVERNFGFKIKPEEMVEVVTLEDFYNYIERKIAS